MLERLRKITSHIYAKALLHARRFMKEQIVWYGYQIRTYNYGEDPSTIDFEETIQHLLTYPKPLNQIQYKDFLIRKEKERKVAVVFLLDISGSIQPKALFNYIACCIMLLEILSKEYLAIAFFEGDTYVVKTFRQKIDLDEIIEDLISANILYGTMVSSSLVWAKEQFGQTNASRNLCLIFSDGNFFDFEDACHEFDVLRRQGVKNIVISIESRNQPKGEKIEQLKASGTDYIDIRSGEDALTVVTRILGKDLRFSMSTDSI